ncbi:MAG: AAA family ATPase [Nanoarchaeota archaeon]|nr:AAA family ATPase [Nanoarchaeota archaeon]
MPETKEMKLRVGELTDRDDFGRGIARIDSRMMNQIGVKEGDIIEVEGARKSGAVAIRAYPVDIGAPLIRIDGLVRKNCGTGIGETVIIRKAPFKEARKIALTPAERGVFLHISPNLLKQNLFMRPIVKGDIIAAVPAFRRSAEADEDFGEEPFGLDILSEFFNFPREVFFPFGTDIKLMAVESEPAGIVQITDNTRVELLNEVDRKKIPGFSPTEMRGLREEAKEVKEIRQVPLVTYEDIGGIQDAVKKVREMIELPLRHPELFERLGVEPPKGVLLYGPPGTGKTLLAKAVANEAGAHFISLAGPEIMSKWYGQSLPYNEKIILMENGTIKKKPIGEVVENGNKEDLKVLAFDEKGKINFCKVTDLIKHKNNSKILEVKTRSGRRIKVTDYHSLFTLSGCKIKDIKTSELIPGKSFIAVPKTIPIFGKIEEIDFLESLRENDFGLRVRNIQRYVKEAREKIGYEKTACMLGYSKKYLSDMLGKNIGIPVSKFLMLMKESDTKYNSSEIRIFTKGKSLPAKIKIDEDFCTFLGLWVAEGSFTQKGEVRLSLNEDEVQDIQKLVERLFGKSLLYKKKNTKGCDIYICSRVLGKFLKNILSLKSGAKFKNIPEIIFNLDKSRMAAFLKGYFSGDGSVYPNQHGVPTVEGSTVSGELADDLTYLLLHFGIVAKIYRKVNDAGNIAHRVCLTGAENLKRFETIRFLENEKNILISKFLQNVKWSRSPQVPMTPEINSFLKGICDAQQWIGSSSVGVNKLAEFSEGAPSAEFIQTLVNNDIYWDLVDEVAELPKEEYVYDISVEPCQNFVAGFGGIFAHNSEENLRKVFEEAQKNAPAIIFIDEIDAIASKREESGEVERRVVSQLLTLMDGLKSRGKVIVLAATNRPNALDEALRRPGRFDREIEIGVPDKNGRKEILKIHTRNMPLAEDVKLDELAEKTYGYSGADLSALAREAAMSVIRRNMEEIKSKEEYLPKMTEISRDYNIRSQKDLLGAIKTVSEKLQKAEKDAGKVKPAFKRGNPEEEENEKQPETKNLSETLKVLEIMKKMEVILADFNNAFLFVQPSAMREIMIEIPKVKWDDIGGMEEVKQSLKEAVEWPLKNPEGFKRMGISPARGILLYGPPGCGKTQIVKALANGAGVNFISVKGSEVFGQLWGQAEKNIKNLFRRARQVAPSIIFFDEIDAIAPKRGLYSGPGYTEALVSQLLMEMSGIESIEGVSIIAATNRPDIIDFALLRPGRFDKLIYVPAPDRETRKKILEVHTRNMPIKWETAEKGKKAEGYLKFSMNKKSANKSESDAKAKFIDNLAEKTEGYSGADLEAVAREAAMEALREDMGAKDVTAKHFESALKKIKPSITSDMFVRYQKAVEDLKKTKLEDEEKARYIG